MSPAPQIEENMRVSTNTTQKFRVTIVTKKNQNQFLKSQNKKVKKYILYMRHSSATTNFWHTAFGRKRKRRAYN